MYFTLAEAKFNSTLRSLNNLGPDTSDDEIEHHLARHYQTLARHLINYGIEIQPGGQNEGRNLFTAQCRLQPCWDEESANLRVRGLAEVLNPVSVSLEDSDVPGFVHEPMMRAAIQDQFYAFESGLQRISPYEIRPKLEECARAILSQPITPSKNANMREIEEFQYREFLQAAGKGSQLKAEDRRRALDEARREEEAKYAEAAYASELRRRGEDSD